MKVKKISPHLIDQETVYYWINKKYKDIPYFRDLTFVAKITMDKASRDVTGLDNKYGLTVPEWLSVLCEMFPEQFYVETTKPIS